MAILIDAEQLSKHKYVGVEYNRIDMGIPASAVHILAYKWGWNDALDSVAEFAPTVDAVEVVRCENCKFFEDEDEDGDCWCYCHNDITRRDGYCSWGKGRKDGTL